MKRPSRKQVRHFEQNRHLHELTFSCYRRRPLLTNNLSRTLFCRALDAACVEECFQLIAFVIMPEHVHLLVLPLDAEAKVSRLLARTKQPVSRQIHCWLREAGSTLLDDLVIMERPGKRTFRF